MKAKKLLSALLFFSVLLMTVVTPMTTMAEGSKTVRLEAVENPTDGNYFKVPDGVTVYPGDQIIFPEQALTFTCDQGHTAYISNLSTLSYWDDSHRFNPWNQGAQGDAHPLTVGTDTLNVYVLDCWCNNCGASGNGVIQVNKLLFSLTPAQKVETVRLVWKAGENGANGHFEYPEGVMPSIGDRLIFPASQPSVTASNGSGAVVNIGTTGYGTWGQPWANSQNGDGFVYTLQPGANELFALGIFDTNTSTSVEPAEAISLFSYDFNNPMQEPEYNVIRLEWQANADGTGSFAFPAGTVANAGDMILFPRTQPTYYVNGQTLTVKSVSMSADGSDAIQPWANSAAGDNEHFFLTEGENKIYFTVGTTTENVDVNIESQIILFTNSVENIFGGCAKTADVNGDDVADIRDLIRLKKYFAGATDEIVGLAADMDNNDTVDAVDMVALKNDLLANVEISNTFNYKTVNILPLGDSITQGPGTPSAYRYKLYEQLYAAGAVFNFVGTSQSSDPRLPARYSYHDGHGGYTIGPDNSNFGNIYDLLPGILSNSRDVDIILLMLGRNNYFQSIDTDNIGEVYENFMRRVYELKPNAIVYAASLPVMSNGAASDGATNGLNKLIPGICDKLTGEGYEAYFVDMAKESNMQPSDYPSDDIVHPTAKGHEKLANVWYNHIIDKVRELNAQGDANYVAPTRVSGISLTDNEYELPVGGEYTIGATIAPKAAENFTVLWSSNNEEVATVSSLGKVTAVSAGTARITATTLDGRYKSACYVTVTAAEEDNLTTIFADGFTTGSVSNWTGDTASFSTSGFNTWYVGSNKNVITANSYTLGDDYAIAVTYTVSGNESGSFGSYSSFFYGDFEVRIEECAKNIKLYKNGTLIGNYEGSANAETNTYTLRYNNGAVAVYRGGEKLIETNAVSTVQSGTVRVLNGEAYRVVSFSGIELKTSAEQPEEPINNEPLYDVFSDNFKTTSASNWTGDTNKFSDTDGFNAWMPGWGASFSVTSAQTFELGSHYEIDFTYRAGANAGHEDWGYSSFKYGDFEVRLFAQNAVVKLYKNGGQIGTTYNATVADYETVNYTFSYDNGVAKVFRNGTEIISYNTTSDVTSANLVVKLGEYYSGNYAKAIAVRAAQVD